MKKKIFTNIVIIGLVSFFIDMSTEMVYPIVPLFLTATLGATPALVGVIEGIAESIASLLKVFSGYIGDVRGGKKKLVFAGYSASVLYKLLLLLSTSWVGVLFARIIDRTGKGIRTAPRDALVAESAEGRNLGGSYGLHKMLDMAGSAAGAALAFLFVATGFQYSSAFVYSIIPAVIGIMIIFFVRENKNAVPAGAKLSLRGLKLSGRLKAYLAVIFMFCLGNSSNAFLLLKAREGGFTAAQVILLYLIYLISSSALSIPFGKLSDRFGRARALVPGYAVYGLVYIGFALFTGKTSLIVLFAVYGVYTALITGAERAYIAESSPANFKGTILGLYGMLQGIGLLLSSVIAGLLWDNINSDAPFWFGGAIGIISAAAISIILGKQAKEKVNPA